MNNLKEISNEEIIKVLLRSKTVEDAAAVIGITKREMNNRMKDKEFSRMLREAKINGKYQRR